jgi:hypothetical protein
LELLRNPILTLSDVEQVYPYIHDDPNLQDIIHYNIYVKNRNNTKRKIQTRIGFIYPYECDEPLTLHHVLKNHHNLDFYWPYVSYKVHFRFEELLQVQELDLPWNWDYLSMNESIKIEDVIRHPTLPWNWESLSCNKNMTFYTLKEYPELPWDLNAFSFNESITLQGLLEHPEYWDRSMIWVNVSKKVNIKDVLRHPRLPWNFWVISQYNPHISLGDVLNHPELPWWWCGLSTNPSIFKLRINDPDFPQDEIRRHMAAFKIQTQWRQTINNPRYHLCKKRLMKDFDELHYAMMV